MKKHSCMVTLAAILMIPSFAAQGTEEDLPTVVVSAATVCQENPDQAYCRDKASDSASLSGGAPAGHFVQHQIGVLETRAPWMGGHIRWCDAFPGARSCQSRFPQ